MLLFPISSKSREGLEKLRRDDLLSRLRIPWLSPVDIRELLPLSPSAPAAPFVPLGRLALFVPSNLIPGPFGLGGRSSSSPSFGTSALPDLSWLLWDSASGGRELRLGEEEPDDELRMTPRSWAEALQPLRRSMILSVF